MVASEYVSPSLVVGGGVAVSQREDKAESVTTLAGATVGSAEQRVSAVADAGSDEHLYIKVGKSRETASRRREALARRAFELGVQTDHPVSRCGRSAAPGCWGSTPAWCSGHGVRRCHVVETTKRILIFGEICRSAEYT